MNTPITLPRWSLILIAAAGAVLAAGCLFLAVAVNSAAEARDARLRARVAQMESFAAAVGQESAARARSSESQLRLVATTERLLESHQDRLDALTHTVEMQALDLGIASNRLAAAIAILARAPVAAARR